MKSFLEKFELEFEKFSKLRILLGSGSWERHSRKKVSIRKGLPVELTGRQGRS